MKKFKYTESSCVFLIALVLSVYAYFICKNAALDVGDDYQFIKFLDKGHLVHGWCAHYRFWPLGLFDYNILHLVPKFRTVLGMYVWNVIIMFSFVSIFYIYLKKEIQEKYGKDLSALYSTVGVVFFLFSSMFFVLHFRLIYPERFMIFTLSAFMLAQYIGYKEQSTAAYIIAIIFAIYSTYCKETVFIIFAVIGIFNLSCKYAALKWKLPVFGQFSKKDVLFNYVLLVNCIVYLALYFIITAKHVDPYTRYYINGHSNFVLSNFLCDWSMYIAVLCFMIYRISRSFNIPYKYAVTDSYMLASIAYAICLIILRLKFDYYFVIPILLITPNVLLSFIEIVKRNKQFYKMLFFVIFFSPSVFFFSKLSVTVECIALHRELTKSLLARCTKLITTDGGRFRCCFSDIDKIDKNKEAIEKLLETEYKCLLLLLNNSARDYVNESVDCVDNLSKNDIVLFYPNNRKTIKFFCRKLLAKEFSLIYHSLLGIYVYNPLEYAESDFLFTSLGIEKPKCFAYLNIANGFLKNNIGFIKLRLHKNSNYIVKFNLLNCKNSRVSLKIGLNTIFDSFSKIDNVELDVNLNKNSIDENGDVIFEIEAWPDEDFKEIIIDKVELKIKND